MTAPETATLAEFAALLRVKRSYVTALKKADRLVLTADGKAVQVAASVERIRATADPSKAGVVAHHATHRGEGVEQGAAATTPPDAPDGDDVDADDTVAVSGYQDSRARREHYQALEAQRAYEVAIGKLMDAAEVAAAVSSAAAQLRVRLESLPAVLAPQLAAIHDEGEARAALTEAIEHALTEASRQFAAIGRQVAA